MDDPHADPAIGGGDLQGCQRAFGRGTVHRCRGLTPPLCMQARCMRITARKCF